jgi:CRISPR-associated protein Cas2
MKLLIAYDVGTADEEGPRRLRRVARACMDYGQRVQKSVFECTLGDADWARLLGRLRDTMDDKRDSLRVYHLDAGVQVEHWGAHEPPDLDAPLIL